MTLCDNRWQCVTVGDSVTAFDSVWHMAKSQSGIDYDNARHFRPFLVSPFRISSEHSSFPPPALSARQCCGKYCCWVVNYNYITVTQLCISIMECSMYNAYDIITCSTVIHRSDRQKGVALAAWSVLHWMEFFKKCMHANSKFLDIWETCNRFHIYPYNELDWKHFGDQTKEKGCNSVYLYNYVHIKNMNITTWPKNSQFQFELQLKREQCIELQLIYQLPLLQLLSEPTACWRLAVSRATMCDSPVLLAREVAFR